MAKAITKEQLAIWQENLVIDMRDHCRVENAGLQVNDNRRQLAERRQAFITEVGTNFNEFVAVLAAILTAWTGTKGQKQSFKRSYAKAFHAVHEDKALQFKGDQPIIAAYEAPVEKSWDEVVSDTMMEHGASQTLVAATIRTMEKERKAEEVRRAELQEKIRADLRNEKARSVEELKAKQAELEKELAALA